MSRGSTLAAMLLAAACSRESAPSTQPGSAPQTSNEALTDAAPAKGDPPPSHLLRIAAAADADLTSTIRTERLAARARGSVLVVDVSATWCEPCKRFKAALDSGRLDARLARVTLLELDVDRDGERIAAAGYVSKTIPYFVVPRPDGTPSDQTLEIRESRDVVETIASQLEAWSR